MNNRIQEVLTNGVKEKSPLTSVVKLFGDASYRAYYRATLEDGRTYVVMQMPAGKASASEEITNFRGIHAEPPFINIANYLRRIGLPVPVIHHYSREHQMLILEDLGDTTFASAIKDKDDDIVVSFYKEAIDLLVRLQRATDNDTQRDCVAMKRSFDETLFNWEFDHFLEYGIEARLGLKLTPEDRKLFDKTTREISTFITSKKYGFTHRDFQSRNLMIRPNGTLVIIDFQDALVGPEQYDLVALLRDSYINLGEEIRQELVNYYCKKRGRNPDAVNQLFDVLTVQRKLKDAGRFVYIDRVKGNPNFLQYIPTSLKYVHMAISRLPQYAAFQEMLTGYIPEWREYA